MNSSKIIQDQIKTYKDNFLKNPDSPLGTFQNNRETQYQRFEHIIKPFRNVMNRKLSFHDLGCGNCDMFKFLELQGLELDYSGTDVIEEMLQDARLKYPGIKVFNRDVLEEPVSDSYDVVVFSGGLYLPGSIPHEEWKEFVFNIIDKMFQMCKVGISFNLLTSYSSYRDPDLFFMDPKEILDYCISNLSRFVNIDHAYPLYEYTVSVFRKEYIASIHPQEQFAKYLK